MPLKIRKLKRSSKQFQIASHQIRNGTIERLHSSSKYLNHARFLDLYLPPGYAESEEHYPVLYMHDGNNLFFPEIAFGGMPWKMDQTLDLLIALKLVNPIIVVGIYNTIAREDEYSWSRMRTQHGYEGGQGVNYARYLTQELKPAIDQYFRTLRDAQNTAVMGSSMGGLISFYLGLYHPNIFAKLGLVSPSLWWNHFEPLRLINQFPFAQGSHHLKIWLDMGTREGNRYGRVKDNANILSARSLKAGLQSRRYQEGHDLAYLEDRGGLHNEWWWGQRVHLPLMFFFGTPKGQRLIWKQPH